MKSTGLALRAILGLAWRADRWRVLGTLAITQAQGFGMSLLPLFLKWVTDAAQDGNRMGVLLAASAIAFAEVLAAIARMVTQTMGMRRDENTGRVVDETLLRLSLRIPTLEHHENPQFHDKLAILQERRYMLLASFQYIVGSVVSCVQIVVTVALLVRLHRALILLPLFSLPSMWAATRGHRFMHKAWDESAESQRKVAHLFSLATSPSAGKELRIFGLDDEMISRYTAEWTEIDRVRRRAETREEALGVLGSVMLTVGYVGSLGLVASRAASGDLTAGDMLMALVLAARAQMYVGVVATVFRALPEVAGLGRRLLWLEDYADSAASQENASSVVPDRISSGIEFCGVDFRYGTNERLALSGVTFNMPAGSTVALVGENGSGKSTVVKLLCRLYAPTAGRIAVDGISVSDFDVEQWRGRISAGFQDFSHFEFLLRETVGVGNVEYIEDREAVEAALDRADALALSSSLRYGLETQLGRSFADGVDLSGGEWQKLAIGRAMMRHRPLLLILDEPTANLDAETEHILFDRYSQAAREGAAITGGITVLVSHRFSTVRRADLIVVMSQGRAVEIGSHDELMAAKGQYAEAFTAQAAAYS
ncbi:MAG: ABC transporter ATP-binding protein [Gammaproteobacteria bacterium]